MRSTGEVMGIDATLSSAYAKAAVAAGQRLPSGGKVFITMTDKYKARSSPLPRCATIPSEPERMLASGPSQLDSHRCISHRGSACQLSPQGCCSHEFCLRARSGGIPVQRRG